VGPRTRKRRRDTQRPLPPPRSRVLPVAFAVCCGLLASGIATERLPSLALAAFAAVNLLTFAMYARDKRAAQRGLWRTPESQLHLLELLGGWPAAGLAQQALRHKRAKPAYRKVFVAMVAVHLLALGLWTFA